MFKYEKIKIFMRKKESSGLKGQLECVLLDMGVLLSVTILLLLWRGSK